MLFNSRSHTLQDISKQLKRFNFYLKKKKMKTRQEMAKSKT